MTRGELMDLGFDLFPCIFFLAELPGFDGPETDVNAHQFTVHGFFLLCCFLPLLAPFFFLQREYE